MSDHSDHLHRFSAEMLALSGQLGFRSDAQTPNKYQLFGAVEQITGYTQEQIRQNGATLQTIIHPDDLSLFEKLTADAKKSGKSVQGKIRINRSDGSLLLLNLLLHKIENGQIEGLLRSTIENADSNGSVKTEWNAPFHLTLQINEAPDVETALSLVLDSFARETTATCGMAWMKEDQSDRLKLTATFFPNSSDYHILSQAMGSDSLPVADSLTREVFNKKSTGWISRLEKNCSVDTDKLLLDAGLKSAVAIPVTAGGDAVAVLSFFFDHERDEDPHYLDLISYVASQLGTIFNNKLSRKELQESEKRYRSMFDESLNGNFIAEGDGSFTDCNSAFIDLFRFDSKESALKSELNNLFSNATHRQFFWKALKLKGRIENHEMSAVAANGETIYIIINVIATIRDGEIVMLSGQIQDITDRKTANMALKQSEERLRSLIETSNEWIWDMDKDFRFTYSSFKVRSILGRNPQKILGNRFFDLLTESDLPSAKKRLLELAESESDFVGIEFRCHHKTGSIVYLEVSGTPIFDKRGYFSGFRCISRDITDRKHAELKISRLNEELELKVIERTRQLELTNRELEAFSYSVSHDLRAPLRSIDGFSQAFLEDYGDTLDDTGRAYLDRVRQAAQRMSVLIDDLIKLSKVTRVEMTDQEVNLSDIVSSASGQLCDQHPDRTIDFHIDDGLIVQGDASLLRIALQNLLENSVKFTSKEERAVIEFGSFNKNGDMVFYLKDNGAGFNMEYANKLFTPFQRLHREKDFPGTGIGLATVQRIIHRHMGKIWAESEKGEGATFCFTLPVSS
ncbi:MAG: PAS domain S-box protein [Balneolaceae bacterium]|nr:PAS domain S-box protein [Balneolaceae bacterium]MCH8548239.1 PAS domain S-box protein [Balneolaceae bacterium]